MPFCVLTFLDELDGSNFNSPILYPRMYPSRKQDGLLLCIIGDKRCYLLDLLINCNIERKPFLRSHVSMLSSHSPCSLPGLLADNPYPCQEEIGTDFWTCDFYQIFRHLCLTQTSLHPPAHQVQLITCQSDASDEWRTVHIALVE